MHTDSRQENARGARLRAAFLGAAAVLALGSFGPDMTLAKELLAADRRETVLTFLESCGRFWHSGTDRITDWARSIKGGDNPWKHEPRP